MLFVIVVCVLFAISDAANLDMGCGKINTTHHYEVMLKYYVQPDNQTGRYPNGTRVRATCPTGNRVIGPKGTVCRGNQWIPTIRRCPYRCHVDEVIKKGYVNTTHPNDKHPTLRWRFSNTVSKFLCQRSVILVMHTFYLSIPWIINETEYNCSSRTLDEWRARGSVNLKQGAYFLTTGTIYIAVYILSLIGMYRAKLLHIPCYRLMFFNGFLDMMDIIAGSLIVSYLHFTGGVYCTNPGLNFFLGHSVWSIWMAASVICVALAINRIAEMIPSMSKYRSMFKGRRVYIWMAASLTVLIVRPFITRPLLYNSSVSALLFAPVTSDNIQWEIDYYTPFLLPLHNISFPIILVLLYLVLCVHVFKVKGLRDGKVDKVQLQRNQFYITAQNLQLFLQSLVICTSTAVASTFYAAVEFFPVPKSIVIFSNVMWQLSHGIHGLVYTVVNKKIRGEVLKLFGMKGMLGTVSSTAVTTIGNEETFARRKKIREDS